MSHRQHRVANDDQESTEHTIGIKRSTFHLQLPPSTLHQPGAAGIIGIKRLLPSSASSITGISPSKVRKHMA
jgi:hypothetical protein